MLAAQLMALLLALSSSDSVVHAAVLPEASSGITVDLPASERSPVEARGTIAKVVLPGYTIRRTVPEVRLQFTVTDEQGRLLKNVSSDDLHILDNRIAVPRIQSFLRLEDLPLEVGILLDVSDSVEKNVQRERQAMQIFVSQVVRPRTDRVALMAFGNELRLWQRFTGDREALILALARVSQRGYLTYLYDSVYHACLDQFAPPQGRDPSQRILVLISDGEDTGSLHTMADAVSAAQRREVQIYAISVHKARQVPPGDGVLKQLAESTGGHLYVAASEKEFPALFTAMEQQMRTQYSVSFHPADPTPGFHSVQIQLPGEPKFRVQARSGYIFETQ